MQKTYYDNKYCHYKADDRHICCYDACMTVTDAAGDHRADDGDRIGRKMVSADNITSTDEHSSDDELVMQVTVSESEYVVIHDARRRKKGRDNKDRQCKPFYNFLQHV